MNRLSIILKLSIYFGLLLLSSFLVSSCTDSSNITRKMMVLEPEILSLEEVRSAVSIDPPAVISNRGKIYLLGNFLFLNDPGEGIHIIDNSDPSNPKKLRFINIPGNYDMAGKGKYLYADSYMDMLVFDISDVDNIQLTKRVEKAFPNGYQDHYYYFEHDESLVKYNLVEKEITYDEQTGIWWNGGVMMAERSFSAQPSNASGDAAGIGGSMARFTISDQFIYVVDHYTLHLFDISNLADPVKTNKVDLGWGIETIFPYEDKLFIGANNGMHIYDISDPAHPDHLSTFQHVTSCDPVVVQGDKAYVTLRSGNNCMGFTNQLDVIDVSDLRNPTLIKTYPMQNPHGLGIDQNTLFLCEGEFGLKVFDAADDYKISQNLIFHHKNIDAFDVIPYNNVLILTGEDGLFQYDYSDPTELKLLSVINTNNSPI